MKSPGMLMQFPASIIPTILVSTPQPHNEELFLAVEEADFDEKGLTPDSLYDTSWVLDSSCISSICDAMMGCCVSNLTSVSTIFTWFGHV